MLVAAIWASNAGPSMSPRRRGRPGVHPRACNCVSTAVNVMVSAPLIVVARTFCLALTGGKRFGKAAVGEIPQQPWDIAELVVRHGVAHRGSHLEKHCHLFRAKPVVAAFLEDEAVLWASTELVHF